MQAFPLHNFLKRRDAETCRDKACGYLFAQLKQQSCSGSQPQRIRQQQTYAAIWAFLLPENGQRPRGDRWLCRSNVASASVSPLLLWQRHPDGDASAKQCAVYRQTRRRPSVHSTCCIQQCRISSETTSIYSAVHFNQKQSFILSFSRSRRRGTLAERHMDERRHNILGRDFAEHFIDTFSRKGSHRALRYKI